MVLSSSPDFLNERGLIGSTVHGSTNGFSSSPSDYSSDSESVF